MIGLVLDTNVVVSANIAGEGLEALVVSLALIQRVFYYVSQPILEEYERVLRYPRLRFLAADVDLFLAKVYQAAIMVTPTQTLQECPHAREFLELIAAAP